MPEATPDDVRGVIDTDLLDPPINDYLADAAFAINHHVDMALETPHRRQLEKYLAAFYIVQSKDRSYAKASEGRGTLEHEGDTVAWLRERVQSLDPSGMLATPTQSRPEYTVTREDVTE